MLYFFILPAAIVLFFAGFVTWAVLRLAGKKKAAAVCGWMTVCFAIFEIVFNTALWLVCLGLISLFRETRAIKAGLAVFLLAGPAPVSVIAGLAGLAAGFYFARRRSHA